MGNNFSTQGFSKFQELEDLDLSGNDLSCSDLPNLFGFTSLTSLKLYNNNFNYSLLLLDMQNLRNLKSLDLSNSHIDGSIEGLCKLKDLVELDISYNMLSAPPPECLSNLTNLKVLNLGYNLISDFPSFISNLTSLTHLSLYKNYMKGSFSLSTLANHSKLQALYISSQSIGAHIETENIKWLPKFQLKYLVIRNCNLNMDKGNVIPSFLSYQYNLILIDMSSNKLVGSFPSWLQHNDGIQYLDISNNSLSGLLPKDIDIFLPTVTYLKISQNSFEGNIPGSIGKMKKVMFLDFSYNHFSGYLPKNLVTECNDLQYLKLSNNFLQGNIPKFSNLMNMGMLFLNNNNFTGNLEDVFGNNTRLELLDISNNSISGTIPSSFGMNELFILLLNENLLEGYIPVEISNKGLLEVLDLSQNKLIGSIPNLSIFKELKYLYLQKNNLSGNIPLGLSGNSELEVLDLRDNKFSGKIPNWLDKLSYLSVLLLGGNNLEGDIPIQLCRLKKINIMDLSRNMLKSSIPSCFQNLSFGKDDVDIDTYSKFTVGIGLMLSKSTYVDSFLTQDAMKVPNDLFDLFLVDQSLEVEFRTKNNYYFYKGKILANMTGLDLSCNKLTGTIPSQIGNLEQIRALNLSHNYFSGHIPITFSNLTQIESLDLSYNNLSGKIPGELTQLTFLSIFNVSYNNFSGTPPITGQFGGFDEENYKGNPGLCGPLLDRKCDSVASSPSSQPHDSGEKESKVDMISFYWSFAASYITILLSIITMLYINARWRMAWFYFISKTIRKRFPNFPKLY
ncbi:receptor-like protein 15 [Vicia villosa]|uniref:receptor-like protein 15 n=1 Tax=Vicia villosa TaxID=3911 RepID=UPI00273BBDE7|nr:receptor-like protein 15 [Vicia villosa]